MALVAGEGVDQWSRGAAPTMPRVLGALGRRSLPHVLEATIVPAVIFYVVLNGVGAGAAMIAVLVWTFIAIGRRLVFRAAIPSILLLATIGISARTVVGLASGSTFAYFIQPVATALALAGVFAGSVFIGRPVVARLACDFCHLEPEVASRPGVVRLFQGLTLLWAGVHALTAFATFAMLLSLPTATYVAVKTAVCLAISGAAVALTVSWALRTAHHENLVFATVTGRVA
jgi:hypothetical protein